MKVTFSLLSMIIILLCLVLFPSTECTENVEQKITCGSVIKLVNSQYSAKLHSRDAKYGTGSQQQIITAVNDPNIPGCYFQIAQRNGADQCQRGRPIKCNQMIRLTHVESRKNLHSHHFKSPLSDKYEVSAFGDDGVGDEGDDWKILCSGTHWQRSSSFRLKHISTDGFLHLTGQRYGRPISGHYEVSVSMDEPVSAEWKVGEGIFVHQSDQSKTNVSASSDSHDEL